MTKDIVSFPGTAASQADKLREWADMIEEDPSHVGFVLILASKSNESDTAGDTLRVRWGTDRKTNGDQIIGWLVRATNWWAA